MQFPFRRSSRKNWLQKLAQQIRILIIARGPSGSGKSHMVKELSQKLNAPVFSSDDFFMQNNQYNFDVQRLSEAHEWNQKRTENAMQNEVPVIIVDNTNSKKWEMRVYTEAAIRHGYIVEFKEPDWDKNLKTPEGKWNVDFLEKMQGNPDRKSVNKTIPRHVLERMVSGYEYNPTVEDILKSEKPNFGVK